MTITSTEPYTAATAQAKQVTERGVEAFKKGAKTFADQATAVAGLPTVDLTEPVTRYFDYIQKTVDLNRELATKWAELFTSLSGTVREQAEKVGTIVTEQSEAVADLAGQQAAKADELAREKAEQAEQAKRDEEKAAKAAERAEAKQAKEQAREPYEGLTKAELSDQLAERGLPKTGNVDELIERLVGADSE
jgi:SAP domain